MSKGLSLGRLLTDDGSAVALTAADMQLISASGARVARVELRLGSAHQTWDPALLANYRAACTMLVSAGLRLIGILDASVVAGATQIMWNQNDTENTPGVQPTNTFIDSYIRATAQIALSLGDLITSWEIWNEPNAYRTRSGTVYTGESYIYPSLMATLLTRAYQLLTALTPSCTVITGGLFGHNMYGLNQASSGASYFAALCEQLKERGAGLTAPWPWHQAGQHLYLDQGGATTIGHITTYLDYLSSVLASYGVPSSAIALCEAGWTTSAVSEVLQGSNLGALYDACASRPVVTDVCWFLLHDNQAAKLYYGLCTDPASVPPLQPKQAYGVYQAVP